MGLFFDVQCPQCGYEKSLTEGECGKEHLNNMRIKKEFELGKGNRALRTSYDTRQMDVKEFFEDEALQTESGENGPHNGYICRAFCPQCGARLKVISSGIVDA